MTLSPDPHGQAALMLCESLMLCLIETGVISKNQAFETVTNVIDVKRNIAGETESAIVSMVSIALLKNLAQSLAAAVDPKLRDVPDLFSDS